MQIFFNKVKTLEVEPLDTVEDVKRKIQEKDGVPAEYQNLVYAGRQLGNEATIAQCGVEKGSTLHLVFALCGGKGGFGALLRGAGRAALTDNFDACRDLSGRRMRHVNADAKLAEWAAGARERELEKLGLKHTREQERLAQREAAQQVDMDDVRRAQETALAAVMDAMHSALADTGKGGQGKRTLMSGEEEGGGPEGGQPPAKKRKAAAAQRVKRVFDDPLDSDFDAEEEDEEDEEDLAPAARQAAPLPQPNKALSTSGSNSRLATIKDASPGSSSSGSDQEPLPSGAVNAPADPAAAAQVSSAAVEEAAFAAAAPQPDQDAASVRSVAPSAEASVILPGQHQQQPASLSMDGTGEAFSVVGSTLPLEDLTTAGSTAGTLAVSAAAGSNGAVGGAKSGTDSSLKPGKGSCTATAEGIMPEEPVDLSRYGSAQELEALGLTRLKAELQRVGLKCGGSLADRAARLFLLKGTPLDKIDRKHLAKPAAGLKKG